MSYSTRALDQRKITSAREAFRSLTEGIELHNARFLDIGFGQGLALFFAAKSGAEVFGIDVDPVCREAVAETHRFFPAKPLPKIQLVSVLDDEFVRKQQDVGGFDVVYSWGALHHTGHMIKAFRNAAAMVKDNGYLIISIYNKHWTSPLWHAVKYVFNRLPSVLQGAMVWSFYPLFYFRALSLARGNDSLALRGMDLRHDARDWLGGYPYEYASPREVQQFFSELGFIPLRCERTRGFTGCNEFVFRKKGSGAA